jgi:hypothetical protein
MKLPTPAYPARAGHLSVNCNLFEVFSVLIVKIEEGRRSSVDEETKPKEREER